MNKEKFTEELLIDEKNINTPQFENIELNYIEEGDQLIEQGDFDRAIIDYTKAISLYDNDEDRAMSYLYRSTAYIAKSDYHNAITDTNAAIKTGYFLDNAYLARGIAYLNLGPMGQAFDDWKKSADLGCKGALIKLKENGIIYTPIKKEEK